MRLFNLFYGPGRISTLFLTVLSSIQGLTLVLLFSQFINEVEFLVLLFSQFINELKLKFCQFGRERIKKKDLRTRGDLNPDLPGRSPEC